MEKLIAAMKVVLAESFAFYLKAHGFHWNVFGVNFQQYHDLFGTIYEEVYGSVDEAAEQIRALGSYAPAGLAKFNSLSDIGDENKVLSAKEMVTKLLADNETILASIITAYDLAEENECHGLSNFLADRQNSHKKHEWQLKASIK